MRRCNFTPLLLLSSKSDLEIITHAFAHMNTAPVEHHGEELTGCMDKESLPLRGVPCNSLPKKTGKFRLDLTLSCAPGRRCDRVSSVCHLALWKCSGISSKCDNPPGCLACIPSTINIPDPIKPTIAMTNYIHAPTVSNSSAFHIQLLRSSSRVCGNSTTTSTLTVFSSN